MEIPEYDFSVLEKYITYQREICEKVGSIIIDHENSKLRIKDFGFLELAATGLLENKSYEVYTLDNRRLGSIESIGFAEKNGQKFQNCFIFSPALPLETIQITIDLKE